MVKWNGEDRSPSGAPISSAPIRLPSKPKSREGRHVHVNRDLAQPRATAANARRGVRDVFVPGDIEKISARRDAYVLLVSVRSCVQ